MFSSLKIEKEKILLQFDQLDEDLVIQGNKELQGFAKAGKDKKIIWAQAENEGAKVIVWNPKVNDPVAVRYGWAANPLCNLYNKADLPASPFRTDDWKGITFGKK